MKTKKNEGEIESEKTQSEKAIGDSENPIVSPPNKPKIPFPQRFAKSKLDEQFRKFVPFTEVLSQMSSYEKFLKEILSNKRKIKRMRQSTLRMNVVQSFKTNFHLNLKIQGFFPYLVS